MIGKTLSQYEVQSLLGAGGMGEVYLARDTKLGRSVAVKVLPDAVGSDPDRISRFEREAKLLASLNHPNIAALFGMEQADGKHFIVMELIEGETIAERLRRGPIPVEETIRISHQIAEALEAAHEKGVVHRDLKPANIKINLNDMVKVLDFGLAKVMENAPASANVSNSPTLSMAATQAGVILGTAAYMSPEQAKGFPADARSDVFSFGCVMYEMLVGRQPFQGETSAEVLASVLVREVDLNALPPNINPRMRDLLRRCLEKSAKRRWHAVADLRAELESIAEAPRLVPVVAEPVAKPRPLWKRAIPVVVSAIVFAAIGVVGGRMLNPPAPAAIVRYPLVLPDGQTLSGTGRQTLAISPDGANLVYTANNQLFVRSMADMEARAVSGLNSQALTPFFSPDGKWIGFFSVGDSSFKKIAITGGGALTICKAEGPFGATWFGDQIVFGQNNKGIFRVSENGGNPEVLVKPVANETYDSPELLNGGGDILYTMTTEVGLDRWDKAQVILQSLQTGERKVVLRGGSAARYIPTGHLVYALAGNLLAIPFDLKARAVRGGATPIIEGVARGNAPATSTGAANFAFSDAGLFAYVAGGAAGSQPQNLALAFADRDGKLQQIDLPPQPYIHPRISPDGNQIAVGTDDGKEAIVSIYDRKSGGPLRRLTFGGRNAYPIWTPDGRYITFQSDRDGDRAIFKQAADGSGSAERLSKPEQSTSHEPESWSRDGRTLLLDVIRGDQGIFMIDSADGKLKEFYDPKDSVQKHSSFSPDGRWVAYMSTELNTAGGGVPEVFVQPFPSTGAKYKVSSDGGRTPAWSSDGKQLFYHVTNSNQIMVVDVRTQPSFSVGKATALPIQGTIHPQQQRRNYDVTPDGKQLLVVLPASSVREPARRPTQQINVVLNWFEDLKQRAPIK